MQPRGGRTPRATRPRGRGRPSFHSADVQPITPPQRDRVTRGTPGHEGKGYRSRVSIVPLWLECTVRLTSQDAGCSARRSHAHYRDSRIRLSLCSSCFVGRESAIRPRRPRVAADPATRRSGVFSARTGVVYDLGGGERHCRPVLRTLPTGVAGIGVGPGSSCPAGYQFAKLLTRSRHRAAPHDGRRRRFAEVSVAIPAGGVGMIAVRARRRTST